MVVVARLGVEAAGCRNARAQSGLATRRQQGGRASAVTDERRTAGSRIQRALQSASTASIAALVALALSSAPAPMAEAKVVLQSKTTTKKVFQVSAEEEAAKKAAKKAARAPKPKAPKASGGGPSLPSMSAPSFSAPSLGGGVAAAFAPVVATVGAIGGLGFLAFQLDEGFGSFINEGMAKDVRTYAGTESDLKSGNIKASPKRAKFF